MSFSKDTSKTAAERNVKQPTRETVKTTVKLAKEIVKGFRTKTGLRAGKYQY